MTPRDAKTLLTTEGLTNALPTQAEQEHMQRMTDGVRATVDKARNDDVPEAAVTALEKAQEELGRLEAKVEMSKRNLAATKIQHSAIFPQAVTSAQSEKDRQVERLKGEIVSAVDELPTQEAKQRAVREAARRVGVPINGRRLDQPREIKPTETVNVHGGEHFHTKRGRLFEGDKPPGHRLPKNLPSMHQDDGQPRRICDILSATPWAVQTWRSPGFHALPTQSLSELNIDTAAHILKERITVVFADEVVSEMRRSNDHPVDTWASTPGSMPPFDKLWIEARTGAHEAQHDFVAVAAMGLTIDMQDQAPQPEQIGVTGGQGTIGLSRKMHEELAEHERQRVRAIVSATVWLQRTDGTVWGPIADVMYFLDHDFRVMTSPDPDKSWTNPEIAKRNKYSAAAANGATTKGPVVLMGYIPLSHVPEYHNKQADPLLNEAATLAVSIFCRTCGLMNASNVRYIEGGRTNHATSEKKRAHQRLAWVKYHVLRLKVGTELRSISPAQHPGDRPTPLSMVRGHFKHYGMTHPQTGTWCEPFLGKHYNRTHWCPSFVRGTAEDGVVTKDYEQTTPEAQPTTQEPATP